MEKDEKRRRAEELDRFWEIDALIPPKRAPRYPADTEAVEISFDAPRGSETGARRSEPIPPPESDAPKRHFIPPHTADEERRRPQADEEYVPDNALIHSVRLYRWRSSYRYYEEFARDAERLYPVRGVECARVPFFSYVPQYTQMSRPQLEWYLWWRENLREGRCLETDYSYLLLFVYEVINLSGKTDAAQSQEMLCRLWAGYRDSYRQLDSILPEWICDYSLIHRLPPPALCTGRLLADAMSHCTLKEFYVPAGASDGYVRALLAFCSNYDHHKSKFCTPERRELFDRTVFRAVRAVAEHTSPDGKLFSAAGMDDSKLARDAYSGALCSYRIKRRIEVDFCSFSRSHELRYLITDVVKYTENRLRAHFGIRSRLSVYALPTAIRELLDALLDEAIPPRPAAAKRPREATPSVNEYERLYDLPKSELSLSQAAEIERLSWETTERLIEAFEEETAAAPIEPESASPTAPIGSDPPSEKAPDASDAWTPYLGFLRAVREGDGAGQRTAARAAGKPLEVLADEVNALAADLLGDILLEEDGDGFAVIEDYRETLEALTEQG